mmetsp:Transcript_26303/g.61474  ORF Transcript_26303/g.61474 Transcript_26303/m.61474 type:complete len:202 (-) Transcript_26303:177-782(-)
MRLFVPPLEDIQNRRDANARQHFEWILLPIVGQEMMRPQSVAGDNAYSTVRNGLVVQFRELPLHIFRAETVHLGSRSVGRSRAGVHPLKTAARLGDAGILLGDGPLLVLFGPFRGRPGVIRLMCHLLHPVAQFRLGTKCKHEQRRHDDEGRPRLPVGRTDELLVLHRGVDGRTRRDQCQDTGQHSIPEGVLGRLLRSVLRR